LQKEDIQSLKLMEEISREDGFTTQRELAKRLDVSVGLVNLFIRRVVRKGYFKITTIPGRRVRYLLTSKGFAEKSRLTMSYLRYSLSYYR
jgi:predicted transcriptional regulator